MKKYVYIVSDAGSQGLKDRGIIAIFENESDAINFKGHSWYSIKKVELNVFYPNGVLYYEFN